MITKIKFATLGLVLHNCQLTKAWHEFEEKTKMLSLTGVTPAEAIDKNKMCVFGARVLKFLITSPIRDKEFKEIYFHDWLN